jgi:hypothetical protein
VSDIPALDRFRSLVLGDETLETALAAIDEPGAFAAAALAAAAAHAIPLAEADLAPALDTDPLGLARFAPVAPSRRWPSAGWLAVDIVDTGSGPAVDWAHFGGETLSEPFFAGNARRAIARPFNRLLRWQTPVADFVREAEPRPAPGGLIFHWSRCGSTLVSQMLAALPGSISISEARPLDLAVHCADPQLLRAMAAALGRRSGEDRCFLKLNCWHAIALGLFRSAFPQTPWVFLYRDPVEILVSHFIVPAPEMVPGAIPPRIFGLDPDSRASADYEARILARVAESAIAANATGGGRFVAYSALPDAVGDVVLPHFGVHCGLGDQAAMAAATRQDAKRPANRFAGDGKAKRDSATGEVREAARRHLDTVYERLQALA